MRNKTKTNHTRDFSRALNKWLVIASNSDGFIVLFALMRLVGIISLVLVYRQSFENRSKPKNVLLFGWGSGNG